MLIRRVDIIAEYQQKHADSVTPLQNWMKLVKLAKWQKPQDIKNAIRTVDFLSGNRVIFNIGGNKHRLIVMIQYACGEVIVRWIGTHAEYSKLKL